MGDCLVALESLRLKIRRVRPADSRTFVPLESQPAHRLEDARHHLVGRSLRVGVFDAKDERAAVPAREQPVEQRRARAADVKIPGGRRRESNARAIHPREFYRVIRSSLLRTAARSPSSVTQARQLLQASLRARPWLVASIRRRARAGCRAATIIDPRERIRHDPIENRRKARLR